MYPDLLKGLSRKIDSYFSEIEANYNFDLGVEFEIALCRFFQKVLPARFGVCRGFIIDKHGNKVGDDIIIYDKLRFPTLRFLDEDFAQKERVPFEAVYAYFEVKHNLELNIGPEESTFNKAIEQLKKIKALKRDDRPLNQITNSITLGDKLKVESIPGWPNYFNPLFTGIISRKVSLKVKDKKKNTLLNKEDAFKYLCKKIEKGFGSGWPDLIVAGTDVLAMPVFKTPKEVIVPFVDVKKKIPLNVFKTKHAQYNALALAMCNILRALEFIQLGPMPWEKTLFNGICDTHKKS